MCEHVLAGKSSPGSACGDDGIYIAAIRVCPPQERQK